MTTPDRSAATKPSFCLPKFPNRVADRSIQWIVVLLTSFLLVWTTPARGGEIEPGLCVAIEAAPSSTQ